MTRPRQKISITKWFDKQGDDFYQMQQDGLSTKEIAASANIPTSGVIRHIYKLKSFKEAMLIKDDHYYVMIAAYKSGVDINEAKATYMLLFSATKDNRREKKYDLNTLSERVMNDIFRTEKSNKRRDILRLAKRMKRDDVR